MVAPAAAQTFYSFPQKYPNGTFYVCGVPATGNPCSNQVSIFPTSALSGAINQPAQIGPDGNYGFWVSSSQAQMTIQLQAPYSNSYVVNNGGGGGGSSAWSAITGGTNTSAAMVVGTGAHLSPTGNGILAPTPITQGPAFYVNDPTYGAKCDGSTNDATAIQAAINAAQSNGSGTVVIPQGTCIIGSTLTITASFVGIQGQFTDGSVIQLSTAAGDIIDITGASKLASNFVSYLDLKRSVAGNAGTSALKLTNVGTSTISNVVAYDSDNIFNQPSSDNNIKYYNVRCLATLGAVTNCFNIASSVSTVIQDVISFGTSFAITNAINLNPGSDINTDRFNVSSNGGTVTITGATDVHMLDFVSEAAQSAAAVTISGLGAGGQISFTDFHIRNSAGPAISVTNSTGVQFTGGEIVCFNSGNCVSASGTSQADQFVGNSFRCAAGTNTCTLLSLSGGVSDITVTGNTFTAPVGTPFNIALSVTGSTKNTIVGNTINGFGTTGINVDSTSTGNSVTANIIDSTNITNQFTDVSGASVSGSNNSSGIPFYLDPTKYSWFFDDFISGPKNTTTNTALPTGGAGITWVTNMTAGSVVDFAAESGANGALTLATGNISANSATVFGAEFVSGTSVTPIFTNLAATTFDYRCRAKLGTTSTITATCGFTDGTGANQLAIGYDTTQSDTQWMCWMLKASTATRTAITGTLDTNYHDLRFRSVVAGTVLCSVDGGAEVSVNTNIPTVAMEPFAQVVTHAAAIENFHIDYFWGWLAITR